jgi:hypothetical protein
MKTPYMKSLRFIALTMLALLYLGGTCAQVYGAAFPLIGTGNKAYSDLRGKAKEPQRPMICTRRHMPMVKLVEVSPLVADNQDASCRFEHSQSLVELNFHPAFVDPPFFFHSDRAPPRF